MDWCNGYSAKARCVDCCALGELSGAVAHEISQICSTIGSSLKAIKSEWRFLTALPGMYKYTGVTAFSDPLAAARVHIESFGNHVFTVLEP